MLFRMSLLYQIVVKYAGGKNTEVLENRNSISSNHLHLFHYHSYPDSLCHIERRENSMMFRENISLNVVGLPGWSDGPPHISEAKTRRKNKKNKAERKNLCAGDLTVGVSVL